MVRGLLMELEDHNCWAIAEAVGHRGPHRLQHLLSRAVWDDQQVLDIASEWAAGHLDDRDAVLIVDETAGEKSSAGTVGAARQYSGTVGGVALCQVAVTLTYASSRGHALIGRALYLPEACAADEEHRELAGVPEDVMFASKPQLAGALLDRAHAAGIRAAFVVGDEVYGGRELRRGIRQRGMGYVLAVRANHAVTVGSGRTVTAAGAARMIPHHAWHRMRTAVCLLACIYLAIAVAVQRQQEAGSDLEAGLIPVTVPELLRLLRDIVIPPPGGTGATGCTGRPGDAAISTAPAKPAGAGPPMPAGPRLFPGSAPGQECGEALDLFAERALAKSCW
jgi:SRSO17 transposase